METKQNTKRIDLLSAMDKIVKLAENSQLNNTFFKKADSYINYVSSKLDISKEQSILLSLIVNWSDDSSTDISEIAEYLKCSNISMLRYLDDIEVLANRSYITYNKEKRYFSLDNEVIDAFRKDKIFTQRNYKGLTNDELFNRLYEIFNMRSEEKIDVYTTASKVKETLECNRQLHFCQTILSLDWCDMDILLVAIICHLAVNESIKEIELFHLNRYLDSFIARTMRTKLSKGESVVQKAGWLSFQHNGGLANRETFTLTKKAKKTLLKDFAISHDTNCNHNIINSKNITPKKLFFDSETDTQIKELRELIEEKRYKEIRNKLKEKGFRYGFACLFYGAPGVGKTESVLQLARETGRDIIQVNVEQIKSMWVGESEKNIKEVFDEYRNKVQENSIAPILLFNEADAIIGKRKEGADGAADKMENSLQNILLQELETLDGILIATTNLVGNLDKAFERRFLYKLKFNTPTTEVRTNIWKSMMPEIEEKDALWLAKNYDLSGGQIENVARRYEINNILYGDNTEKLPTICKYCEGEKLEKSSDRTKIGFHL